MVNVVWVQGVESQAQSDAGVALTTPHLWDGYKATKQDKAQDVHTYCRTVGLKLGYLLHSPMSFNKPRL